MAKANKRRVLIVVFDALRPDMVSAELMPNLTAFAEQGVKFNGSRSVFPSETRVNQTTLITGCQPGRHGIVGNKFVEFTASPDRLFNTGDEDQLRLGNQRLNGTLLGVPSLGELLAEHGLRLATLSAGTPGGGRILNHRAETTNGLRFAMHRPDAAYPAGINDELTKRVGPIPPHHIPSLDWLSWATDAWLNYIEPEIKPDVGILWFCEPDNSYHYCGIGSPDNLAAIRHADEQFGRILATISADQLQIITLSDHGQIAVTGESLNLSAQLVDAGFSVGSVPGKNADVALALDSAGGIFVRDNDAHLINRLIDWLQQQPWCGVLSLPDHHAKADGIASHTAFAINGSRAPDIGIVLTANDAEGPWGWSGTTVHDASYPAGGGIHGGLHPKELHNWLALAGSAFSQQCNVDTAAGIIDIMPTVLDLLDVPIPDHVQGRVLLEAYAGAEADVAVQSNTLQLTTGFLHTQQIGHTYYLDGFRTTL